MNIFGHMNKSTIPSIVIFILFTLDYSYNTSFDNSISTRIVVSDTDVQHSGTYNCEPGAAPVASVNVHVLDGKI